MIQIILLGTYYNLHYNIEKSWIALMWKKTGIRYQIKAITEINFLYSVYVISGQSKLTVLAKFSSADTSKWHALL